MAELERIKNRERQMAQKLKEYAGDDWEVRFIGDR